MDFDSPAAAQKAVTALKTNGVQAQMAKVRPSLFITLYYFSFLVPVTIQLLIQSCFQNICNFKEPAAELWPSKVIGLHKLTLALFYHVKGKLLRDVAWLAVAVLLAILK